MRWRNRQEVQRALNDTSYSWDFPIRIIGDSMRLYDIHSFECLSSVDILEDKELESLDDEGAYDYFSRKLGELLDGCESIDRYKAHYLSSQARRSLGMSYLRRLERTPSPFGLAEAMDHPLGIGVSFKGRTHVIEVLGRPNNNSIKLSLKELESGEMFDWRRFDYYDETYLSKSHYITYLIEDFLDWIEGMPFVSREMWSQAVPGLEAKLIGLLFWEMYDE